MARAILQRVDINKQGRPPLITNKPTGSANKEIQTGTDVGGATKWTTQ